MPWPHVVSADDPGRAETLFYEAMVARSANGLWTLVSDSLDALAGLVARRDDHAQSARLIGASDRARRRMGYPRPHVVRGSTLGSSRRFEPRSATMSSPSSCARAPHSTSLRLSPTRPGARGPRGRPSLGWDSLTPTEGEVVALVAEGLTNPQIAERLFVRRATIKTPSSHIFAKLGVSSRAELAAAGSRQREAQ